MEEYREKGSSTIYIRDESVHYKKFYTEIPNIVAYKIRNPYDGWLWYTIKSIAGDEFECWLTTKNLAELCKMSIGKVCECRKYLIQVGLLEGELKHINNDPSALQVWHLRIPRDIWKENYEWRKSIGDDLQKRIKEYRKYRETGRYKNRKKRKNDDKNFSSIQGLVDSCGEIPPT